MLMNELICRLGLYHECVFYAHKILAIINQYNFSSPTFFLILTFFMSPKYHSYRTFIFNFPPLTFRNFLSCHPRQVEVQDPSLWHLGNQISDVTNKTKWDFIVIKTWDHRVQKCHQGIGMLWARARARAKVLLNSSSTYHKQKGQWILPSDETFWSLYISHLPMLCAAGCWSLLTVAPPLGNCWDSEAGDWWPLHSRMVTYELLFMLPSVKKGTAKSANWKSVTSRLGRDIIRFFRT